MVRDLVQLAVQRPATGGQPASRLLRLLIEDRHRPDPGAEHGVMKTRDPLRAEKHGQRVKRHRREGADRHGMPGAPQAGADHDDPGRQPASGPPEDGSIRRRHRPALDGRDPDGQDRDVAANATTTPAAAPAAPPYRNHLPAAVLVITTLPPGVAMASTNDAANHPTADISPAVGVCIPQPASAVVPNTTTANASAAAGTGPTVPA